MEVLKNSVVMEGVRLPGVTSAFFVNILPIVTNEGDLIMVFVWTDVYFKFLLLLRRAFSSFNCSLFHVENTLPRVK